MNFGHTLNTTILSISCLGSLMCFTTDSQTIFPPATMSYETLLRILHRKKVEQNVEFAFDIHKVLLHKEARAQWQIFWEYPHKKELAKCIFNIRLMGTLTAMFGQIILNWFPGKLFYKDVTSNKLISTFQKNGKPELAEFFTTMVNLQRVDPKMKLLLQDLKNAGYKLRLASNIGTQTFLKLKQQFEMQHETIFNYFESDGKIDYGKTVDYTVSIAEKPDRKYFIEFLDAYDSERERLFIFVDDKLVNITAAIQENLVGIYFQNADQLRNDLQKLGILN